MCLQGSEKKRYSLHEFELLAAESGESHQQLTPRAIALAVRARSHQNRIEFLEGENDCQGNFWLIYTYTRHFNFDKSANNTKVCKVLETKFLSSDRFNLF